MAHCYAGRGNEFWQPLYEAGLIGEALDHTDDSRAVEFGVGLTDLGRYIASSSDKGMRERFDPYAFVDRVTHHAPRWIAFNGKEAATRRGLLPVGSDPGRKAGLGDSGGNMAGVIRRLFGANVPWMFHVMPARARCCATKPVVVGPGD